MPVANDFSDLGERLAWCRDHDDACRAIAEAAARRALEVYEPARVAIDLAARLRARLAERAGPMTGRACGAGRFLRYHRIPAN